MAATLKSGGILAPYARGNAVPGGASSVDRVDAEMARRVAAMTAAMPPEVRARFQIISGFRDAARQAQVNPGVKNSRHMHGKALDLGNDPVVLDWINRHGGEHGVGFPLRHMKNEQNHLEMVDRLGGRAPIVGGAPMAGATAPASAPDFGGGSDAAPVYAETGDPQFKSGLALPTSLVETSAPDPTRQAALATLALQQQQSGPFGSTGFGAPSSLGDAFAQAVKSGQPGPQPPATILPNQSYAGIGGPIPLSRRIG